MRTIALILSLFASTALAQVELLADGGSKGKFNHINFAGCTVVGDAGWSTVACAGGGGSGSVDAGWLTAFDCNFSAQSSMPLDGGDGSTYPICGVTWTAIQTGSLTTGMDLVNGDGIVMRPVSSSDWYNTTQNAPGLYVTPSALIPNMTWDTPFRLSCDVDANLSANYDGVAMRLAACSTRTACSVGGGNPNQIGYQTLNKNYTSNAGSAIWNMNYGQDGTSAGGPISANDYGPAYLGGSIGVAEWTRGAGAGDLIGYGDIKDGGTEFPPSVPSLAVGRVYHTIGAPFRTFAGLSGVKLYIGAYRAGSGTTLIAHWHRCKLEYKP